MKSHSPHKLLRVVRPDGREEFLPRATISAELSSAQIPPRVQEEILSSPKLRSLILAELRRPAVSRSHIRV